VFTPKDFLDVGSRAAVDQVLSRLVKQGMVRRLDRGVYDYPKQHPKLGTLSPDSDDLARALAGGDLVFPSGAVAANTLGLSTQVPAKSFYVTNSTVRSRCIAGQTIKLKRARVPLLNNVNHKTNFILQALSYLGKRNIDDLIIKRCAHVITDKDIPHINRALSHVPGWIVDTLHEIQKARDEYKKTKETH
jgi:hypothetical protein